MRQAWIGKHRPVKSDSRAFCGPSFETPACGGSSG
jgi:hypothetical protein